MIEWVKIEGNFYTKINNRLLRIRSANFESILETFNEPGWVHVANLWCDPFVAAEQKKNQEANFKKLQEIAEQLFSSSFGVLLKHEISDIKE